MASWVRTVRSVLRDRHLRLLVIAFFGFGASEQGVWIALLVLAYSLGGAALTGGVVLLQLVPAAIAAPLAAYAGDRFPRGPVLLAGYAVQAVTLIATTGSLVVGADPAIVFLIAATNSIAVTFTRPTHYTLLPDVTTTPEALTAANAVSSLAESAGLLLGPLVGGFLLASWGPASAFAIFSAILVVAVIAVAGVRIPKETGAAYPMTARGVLSETFGGFVVLRTERSVGLPIMVLAVTQFVAGAIEMLVVAVAIELLHAGEGWAGYLGAALGLGGLVGSALAVGLAGRRLTPALAAGAIALGLPMGGLAVAPLLVTAPMLVAASGSGRSVASVSGNTLLQRAAPPAARARVFGVLEGVAMLALALGGTVASSLVAFVGVRAALLGLGVVAPAVMAVLWRPLREVERSLPVPDPSLLALVRSLPIFAPLPAPALERILASLQPLEVPAGHVLIREGDAGDRVYILAAGDVEVTQQGRPLAIRHATDILGEIALLRDVPRTATVVALTPLHLYTLERAPFLEAVTGHPQARATADAVIDTRLGTSA